MAGRASTIRAIAVLVFACLATALASEASAGGVAVTEQGRGLGNAYAGGSSGAEDASTVWWNPAGMLRLERHQIAAAGYLALPTTRFHDAASTDAVGAPLTGGLGGNAADPILLPSLFAVARLSERTRVGLSLNVPFGLSTDYGRTWRGRYVATESTLHTLNVNLAAAQRIAPRLALGMGVSAQRIDATLERAIDFGSLGAARSVPRLAPQGADGLVKLEGDDWSFGFNVGLLFDVTPTTRIGVTYRSRIKHTLRGQADFTVPAAATPLSAATGAFVDTGARVRVTMPDSFSAGIHHEITPQLAIMMDFTWTNWSLFDAARFHFDNPAQPPSTLSWRWHDTLRVALGLTYKPTSRWTLRTGIAYDPSPIPDATRSPRIPGNDRMWVTLGIGTWLRPGMQLDFSYAHLFLRNGPINLSDPAAGTLVGRNTSGVDLIGLQLTLDV